MKRILHFLLLIGTFVLIDSPQLWAQCDTGTPMCGSAQPICLPADVTMDDVINNGGNIPGCGTNFSFHNTSWYAIQVTSNTIGISVTPSNCQNSAGIQAGLYTDCNANSTPIGVQCACTPGGINFSGSGLTPGQYFIMIDGCSGDVCDVNIAVSQGTVANVPPGVPDDPVPDVVQVCPGEIVNLFTSLVPGASSYNWSFPAGVSPISIDCNNATVVWGNTSGTVTVSAGNSCGNSNSNPSVLIEVQSFESTEFGEYCFPDEPGYFHAGTNNFYPGGTWVLPLVTARGCDSTVTLEVTEYTGGINVVNEQICPGECTCLIAGQTFCGPFNGDFTTQNAFGCDSTIIVSVSVLSPVVSINAQPPGQINCQNQGGGLLLTANGTQNNAVYSWWTFTGLITTQVSDNQVFIGAGGRYYVSVTQTGVAGTECGIQPICIAIDSIDISESFNFPNVTSSGTDITCGGANDGTATVVIDSGGVAPFTFLWDDPGASTDSTISGLGAGTWYVTITSADGCESIDSVTLTEPTTVTAMLDTTTPTECNGGSDGSATVTAGGGTTPYTYNIGNGAVNTPTFTGLAAGNYTVTVTDDNGCTAAVDIAISQPAEVTLAQSFSEPSCNGGNDGEATITANGGNAPYTYDIGSGAGSNNVFTGLAAGSYTVTVSDDNGCTETIDVNVTQPTAVTYTSAVVDASCNGGSSGTITITASGGNGPYTYDIGSGAGSNNVFTGLAAGTYTVTVTDDNGCAYDEMIDVDQPASVVLAESSVDASCNGGNDGTVTITANGGTAPFTYNIGAGTQNTPDFGGLSMGSYTVTVTDDNGCTETIDVSIGEPAAISLSEVSTDANCNGAADGETTITAGGGTPPFNYNIGSGDVTNPTFSGLSSGSYTVTVTDDNGCTETIDIAIGQPASVTLSESAVDASCFGGTDGEVTVTAGGGTAPYNYNIGAGNQTNAIFTGLGAGSYTVTVTDDNGCTETIDIAVGEPAEIMLSQNAVDASCFGFNDGSVTITAGGGTAPFTYDIGSGAGPNNTLTGLGMGAYVVTVTDDNGCAETIAVSIAEPAGVSLSEASLDASCNGGNDGSVTITANGGTAPYTYNIGSGASPNPIFNGLSAGSYTVTVTDDNGCTVDIDVAVGEPAVITLGENSLDASCNGGNDGEATITAAGGTAPYSYDIGAGPVANPNFGSLASGNYIVTVTDDNGCTETVDIAIGQPSVIALSSAEQEVSCNGGSNGETTITATGGTGPYTYDIGSGASANPILNGLSAGSYTVTVTDDNGCTETIDIAVGEPAILTLAASGTDALCFGGDEGTASSVAAGGTAPYTYDIGNGPATNPDFATLSAGNYTITVTDDNGCSAVASLTIDQPAELEASATSTETFCAGGSDGTITATATGGTPPYMYSVDGGALGSNPSFGSQTTGMHTVQIVDDNGCTATTMIDVGSPTPISLQASGTDALCFGEGSGTTTVVASGGTGDYTYEWSDGLSQITPTAEFLTAGTYTVTVTDERGCTEIIDVAISEPASALSATTSSTDATCGSSNGTITLIPSGGTAPYTYNWSNSTATQNQAGLDPGNFGYTITDNNGCVFDGSETVSTPSGLEALEATTDASCNGGADGTISITINGGTQPYDIVWSDPTFNGQTDLTGLASGPYTVTITDFDGCTITSSQTVNEPTPLELILTPNQASCGLSDGSINVLITGGTPNTGGSYSFDWSDNSLDNIEDPTGIPQGTYTLIVTDDNGCSITASTDVTVPNSPALNFTQIDVDCNGASTGSISVEITGGEGPYDFNWSDDNYDGVEDPIAMPAGTYTLIVTDSKNCTDDITVTLTEPTPIEITQFNSVDATCGDANGSISITVQGGTGAYTYDWSDDLLDGQEDPTGLVPGNYFVTVSDANGCSTTQDVSVSTPNGLELAVNSQDASCAGGVDGTIDITINGGVGPFDVVWDNTIAPGETNPTGLAAGSYEVVVTDASGCTVSSNVTIDQPTPLDVVASITDASCLANDGAINVTVTGGTPDMNGEYSYQWDNGAGSVQDPTGLGPNTYNLIVTDANGCTFDFSADVTIPNAPVATASIVDAQCNGALDGIAAINIVGGQDPYTYDWSNGLTTSSSTALGAGNYTVTITDVNNCTDVVDIIINEPAPLSVTGTSMEATCGSANGSIDIEVMGGTSPYTYTWSNGAGTGQDPNSLLPGTYEVTITDLQGCELVEDFSVSTPNALEATRITTDVSCNGGDDGAVDVTVTGGTAPYNYLWSNAEITDDITGLTAGSYTLSITDDDGCLITVSVSIDEPTAIQTSTESFDATCNQANGSINLSVTGGTPPYQFAWDGGAGNMEDPQNLLSGNYNVTVTDDNGCTTVHSETVNTPNGVVLLSTTDDVNCFGGSDGSIDVGISGGVGSVSNFIITWSDPSLGNTPNPTGLSAGTYTITVTDEAGCNFSETLVIDEPPLLEAFGVGPTSASCNGGNDGSIDLTVSGGVGPYLFVWDNNAGNVEDPSALPAGTYNVTVTDANGCTTTAQETVSEPAELELSLASTPADCFGSSTGTLNSTVVGGTQPYSYQWNNNAGTDANPVDILAGSYQLVVTDANGCTISSSIAVDQPAMIEISITDESNNNGFNVSCSDAADGYVSVNAAGGNPPFDYAWSNGAAGTSIDNQPAGTYEVVVTDAKGCSETLSVTLTSPEAIDVSFQAVPPICFEDGNGFIFVENVSGGTGPYIYSIDNQPFNSNPAFSNLSGGDYTLNIQDANGCAWTEDVQIIEPEELTVDIGENFEMDFNGAGQTLTPITNTDPINIVDWAWLSGTPCDTCYNLTITPTEETIYEFMIEDVNGCIATDQITVQVRKDRLVYIPNAFTPNGDGVNDRFIIYGGRGVDKIESFLVFDRWGEVVYKIDSDFDPNDPSFGWDGTLKNERLNPGVFVYVAQVRFIDGEVIMYKGDVTLMGGTN